MNPDLEEFIATIDARLNEVVSLVDSRCDMDAVIATLPLIDATRRILDRMQADPPKYRDKHDGYSAL